MAEIPIELIIEFLLRLPVEDLLRFRCVSKKWRNVIDSPNFVKSHLNLPNKPQFVLFIDGQEAIYYLDMDSVSNANSPLNLKEVSEPYSEIYKNNSARFLGHINGLVCCKGGDDRGVILWNPTTRKNIQVPLPVSWFEDGHWCWGFGYDMDSDDYKVVAIALSFELEENVGSTRRLVWIYSLRSGSWKSIDDFPYPLYDFLDGVFSDGALHWIVNPHSDQGGPNLICALHLGKLEYSLVPQPDLGVSKDLRGLEVLDGCLCAISDHYGSPDTDLLVMKEYGLKESWTNLIHYHDRMKPLAYTEDGNELLFVTSHEVVSYEFKTRSFKRLIHSRSRWFFNSVVCIPSLVCPRSDL